MKRDFLCCLGSFLLSTLVSIYKWLAQLWLDKDIYPSNLPPFSIAQEKHLIFRRLQAEQCHKPGRVTSDLPTQDARKSHRQRSLHSKFSERIIFSGKQDVPSVDQESGRGIHRNMEYRWNGIEEENHNPNAHRREQLQKVK